MRSALAVVMLFVAVAAFGVSWAAVNGDEGWTPPPDARERLERILDDPAFQLEEPTPGPAEKMMAAVREFFFELFSNITHALAMNSLIMTIILWAVISAALVGSCWLIVRLTRDRGGLSGPGLLAIRTTIRPVQEQRSPEELLAGARAAWKAGRPRDVLRLSLAASIMALRSAGHLPGNRSMTDLEGARALEQNGPDNLKSPFRKLVLSHDRLVYAGLQPDTGDLDQALDLAGRIVHPEGGSGGVDR